MSSVTRWAVSKSRWAEGSSASKIRGWFDPPLVMKTGFNEKSFIAGPLVRAMKEGGLFFFNEVNRAPSESINGVLAVMDEREVEVPQLERMSATDEFYSIFTLNPLEYVGTIPESILPTDVILVSLPGLILAKTNTRIPYFIYFWLKRSKFN